MVRKSPDKQWNRQNSILFNETISLKIIKNRRDGGKIRKSS
jgi:hypothetical protein